LDPEPRACACAVTRADLESYRALLISRYASSTVGRKLASLRTLYRLLHGQGLLPTNPTTELRAPRDASEKHSRVKWYDKAIIHELLALPNANEPQGIRDRTLLALLAVHGLRESEVVRAQVSDLDLAAGAVGQLRVTGPRDRPRVIDLTPKTRDEMERWLAVRKLLHTPAQELFVNMNRGGAESSRHAGLTTRGVRGIVDGYLVRLGQKQPGQSGHALRYALADDGRP
jgi:site-specific recombinase XerD